MNQCRGCKRSRLYGFLPMGDHPLANGFLREEQLDSREPCFPLEPHVCLDCGLIQIQDHVPPQYFRNYVYVPSASTSMQAHFGQLAEVLAERFFTTPDALGVDIGCNDGLLLKGLKSRGLRVLGVDPATNIVEMAREHDLQIVNEYFDREIAASIRAEHGPASVIVTTNTFHHIDDLDVFTGGVAELLAADGTFVVEVPHALELIENNEFDGIYHEHVSQFTIKSFVDLAARFDLEVYEIQELPVHGGSVRVFMRRAGEARTPAAAVQPWLDREARHRLLDAATYDAFAARVDGIKRDLLAMLRDLRSSGKRIAGYGASARGNTLLNYFGIGTDLLDYIVDRNELKQGLYSPGMHIPVVGVDHLMRDLPDCLLVIAWNFADEILDQLQPYGERGGRFLLPLPEPRFAGPA